MLYLLVLKLKRKELKNKEGNGNCTNMSEARSTVFYGIEMKMVI